MYSNPPIGSAFAALTTLALAACAPNDMRMMEQPDGSISRPDVVAMDRVVSQPDAAAVDGTVVGSDAMTIADDAAPPCDGDSSACPMRANAAASCVRGQCQYSCTGSFANCNGEPRDGCELDTATNVNNCGACGTSCPAANNAMATCTAGACLFQCSSGFADCDRDRSNGCEADTARNPEFCGTCATRCMSAPNANAQCTSGTCTLGCAAGFGNCDGNNANGCELAIATDVTNCGACGTRCATGANATARCAMGMCSLACESGFGNCDSSATNGCEATLATDANNCGACGTRCTAAPNSVASCRTGACVSECATGFADCDGNSANGCEVDTRTSLMNCGACNAVCTTSRPGTVASCVMSACRPVCAAGFFDCDANAANGCEIDARSSAANCGACGNVCPAPPNTTPSCTSSMCGIRCNAGFSDCDGNSANGCETPRASCL